jgi:hypothetical protein
MTGQEKLDWKIELELDWKIDFELDWKKWIMLEKNIIGLKNNWIWIMLKKNVNLRD